MTKLRLGGRRNRQDICNPTCTALTLGICMGVQEARRRPRPCKVGTRTAGVYVKMQRLEDLPHTTHEGF